MSDRIVMLIIMRIKYRFLDYSLAPNANRAQYRAANKESDMNKKLIQQLLDDDETRLDIASMFGVKLEGYDCPKSSWDYDDIMVKALNELNGTPVKGEMITIQVSPNMWVRGKYYCTAPSGEIVVETSVNRSKIIGASYKYYQGKRVDLVIKGEEGVADV